jgi:hypothetical protein
MWPSKKGNFDGLYKQIITKKGNLMDYINRSCDFLKNEKWKWGDGLCNQVMWPSKKGNLMDYISWSCDFLKIKSENGEMAYVSGSCDLPKKEILTAYISK